MKTKMIHQRTRMLLLLLMGTLTTMPIQGQDAPPVAAQQTQEAPPKRPPMGVQLRKAAVVLRVLYVEDGKIQEGLGTGFFLHLKDDRLSDGRFFSYLVTNRHMAQPIDELGRRLPVHKTFLRLNLKAPKNDSLSEEGELTGNLKWYFHKDEAVDLAVMPLALPGYDTLGIPFEMLLTNELIESERIAEGDRVTYSGYFAQFAGNKKIQPVVREGVIAMMPDEDLPTTLQRLGRVYLADVHVFGGNSGSPILVSAGGIREGTFSGDKYFLLGVVSGFYKEEHGLRAATALTGKAESNSGITIVVPAFQLRELIDQPELKAQRDQEVENLKKEPSKPN